MAATAVVSHSAAAAAAAAAQPRACSRRQCPLPRTPRQRPRASCLGPRGQPRHALARPRPSPSCFQPGSSSIPCSTSWDRQCCPVSSGDETSRGFPWKFRNSRRWHGDVLSSRSAPPAGSFPLVSASYADTSSSSSSSGVGTDGQAGTMREGGRGEEGPSRPLNSASSWDAKDQLGKDYLYRLGQESDNLSITVGAKQGMVDHVFVGDFLGKDADIVSKYRNKVTRSFEYLQGDYYIAPSFLDKVVTFLAKNYLAESLGVKVPLILGVWGGKGQGKTFQVELIFKALGLEPIILSAGEMESEWAGQPGQLIRSRYRDAHFVINNKGKMSCLMINDLDAGIGRFANTQCTVNNQIVVGTLMNLCDNPTRVSIGQDWRDADVINRVPIIVTGNDFSTLWAPLIRDGRMEKFYWQPTRDDIVKIVSKMYSKDGIGRGDIEALVDHFPGQALDFFGALRSRTYDKKVLEWVEQNGGCGKVGKLLVKRQYPGEDPLEPPTVQPPVQTLQALIRAGEAMVREQEIMNATKLSDEYMKVMTGPGIGLKTG